MSAANAAIHHSRLLFGGTPEGEWTSMAVVSDGSYGVPEGLVSSFPVRCPGDGTWEIVKDLSFNDWGKERFEKTVNELIGERDVVGDLLPH
jgi:malate dehydrogenase